MKELFAFVSELPSPFQAIRSDPAHQFHRCSAAQTEWGYQEKYQFLSFGFSVDQYQAVNRRRTTCAAVAVAVTPLDPSRVLGVDASGPSRMSSRPSSVSWREYGCTNVLPDSVSMFCISCHVARSRTIRWPVCYSSRDGLWKKAIPFSKRYGFLVNIIWFCR